MENFDEKPAGRYTAKDNEYAGDSLRACVWSVREENNLSIQMGFEDKGGLPTDESRRIHYDAGGDKITTTDFFLTYENKSQEYRMWQHNGKQLAYFHSPGGRSHGHAGRGGLIVFEIFKF